jgi:hypothetical protein
VHKLLKVFFNFYVVKYTWSSSYSIFNKCWYIYLRGKNSHISIFVSNSSLDFQYYVFFVCYLLLAVETRFLNMCIYFHPAFLQ